MGEQTPIDRVRRIAVDAKRNPDDWTVRAVADAVLEEIETDDLP